MSLGAPKHPLSFAVTADAPANRADLRALYEAEERFVRRVVVRLAGPSHDVEDLVHDVFEVALRRIGAFEGRSAPRTWLYGIAVRVVAGWRRRRRLRRFLGLEEAPEPADPTTPAQWFECREQAERVYRILDEMGDKKRAVFILHEIEGLSGEAIASTLGCPLKTVWTRLFHARREFARGLTLQGEEAQ
jgi:RNA polymerase sigma-70 factor (ECF subfamily)